MKNNNKHKNSFSSKQDFIKFYGNKMSVQEKAAFIENTEKDEFANEAIKGYNLFPNSIKDLNGIDNSIRNKTNNINAEFKNIYVLTTVIIIVSIAIVYFIFPTKTNITNALIQKSKNVVTKVDTHKINILNFEIKNASEPPEIKQITINQAKTDQKLIRDFEKLKPLEKINNSQLSIKNENNTDSLSNNIAAFINMSTSYMHEFKVVDYSKIYRNKIKQDVNLNGSLSAKYENRYYNNDKKINVDEANFIPYSQFLSETMGMLSENNYKDALQNFIIILQQFPNDQNAHFYGGLCYYNLGLYQKSIKHFDAIIESKIIIFAQEAGWYKSLSLINLNKNSEAKVSLKKIISTKGFYSKRASEKLKQIEK